MMIRATIRGKIAHIVMTYINAQPFLDALRDAIHRSKDSDVLIAATKAANAHMTAMRKISKGGGYVDSAGGFDPAAYDLGNLLVKANEMVRRIKIQRKTGKFPKPRSSTAWKLR